jgi:hypothetical protein
MTDKGGLTVAFLNLDAIRKIIFYKTLLYYPLLIF